MLGHKAPHSFYFPEQKYEHAFDDVEVKYPRRALFHWTTSQSGSSTGSIPGTGSTDRSSNTASSFPIGRPEAVKDFAAMIRAYWGTISRSMTASAGSARGSTKSANSTTRSSSSPATTVCSRASTAWSISARCTSPASGFRWQWSYGDLTRDPRAVNEQVLTVDLAPSLLELAGAPSNPGHRRPIMGHADTRRRSELAQELVLLLQLREGVPLHAERTRHPHGGVEVRPLPARRWLARHVPPRAVRSEERSG